MGLYSLVCLSAHHRSRYEIVTTLVRKAAQHVIEHGGTVRRIESAGTRALPQRMRSHKVYHQVAECVSFLALVTPAHPSPAIGPSTSTQVRTPFALSAPCSVATPVSFAPPHSASAIPSLALPVQLRGPFRATHRQLSYCSEHRARILEPLPYFLLFVPVFQVQIHPHSRAFPRHDGCRLRLGHFITRRRRARRPHDPRCQGQRQTHGCT